MRLCNLLAELKRRNQMSCRLTSFRRSCVCDHSRQRTAISDAHNVNVTVNRLKGRYSSATAARTRLPSPAPVRNGRSCGRRCISPQSQHLRAL